MKITLKGCNGKKREIPLEELIEKFWDEQHNPISVVINHVADMFDGMGYVATTGYFDPKDDIESGESDSLTGYYYVEI